LSPAAFDFYFFYCRGQAYVAAFLTKSDKATVEDSTSATAAAGDKAQPSADSSSSSSEGSASGADGLYDIGTFAQVGQARHALRPQRQHMWSHSRAILPIKLVKQ
jgi:hypothetical protein